MLEFKTSFVEVIHSTHMVHRRRCRGNLINPSEILTFEWDRKQKLVPVIPPCLLAIGANKWCNYFLLLLNKKFSIHKTHRIYGKYFLSTQNICNVLVSMLHQRNLTNHCCIHLLLYSRWKDRFPPQIIFVIKGAFTYVSK